MNGGFFHEGIKLWLIERGLRLFRGSHYCRRRNTAFFQAGGFQWGKGLNQSIALAKAGVSVYHAGIVGSDGDILLDACKEAGVNTKYIRRLPVKGGHTMIQVDKNAQNCIILYGGTNQMQTREFVDEVLADFGEGDYLLLQNEINMLDYIIDQAYEKKMKIVMNPSPFDDKLNTCDLGKIYLFLLNEIEGEQITGYKDKDQYSGCHGREISECPFCIDTGQRWSCLL